MKHNWKTLLFSVITLLFPANPLQAAGPSVIDGIIEPSEIINVGSPVPGVVAKVLAERAGFVKQGQPLLQEEASPEKAALERARIRAALDGEIKLQQARLRFARQTYDRIKGLFADQAIAATKKEEAEANLAMARYSLEKAEENRQLAQKELARAQVLLDQKTIRSPISGVIMDRFVSPGELVDSQPLYKVARIDPLRVELILPSTMFGCIRPGMKAQVLADIDTSTPRTATVSLVDRVIDSASGTFGVRLELPNPDYRIPAGLKCTVRFPGLKTTTPDAIGETEKDTHPANNGDMPHVALAR